MPVMAQAKTATILFRRQEYRLPAGIRIREALLQLAIPPEAVLAVRAGQLVSAEEILAEGDVVKLVSAISGG